MANLRLTFALLFLVLFFYAGFATLTNMNKTARLEQADKLSDSLTEFFELTNERCRAKVGEYEKQTSCVYKILDELEIVADLEEDEYKNFNSKTNASGYLVLKNDGRNAMDSDKFVLTKNHEVVDQGCVISGNIEPGYLCRLEFPTSCEDGDVLEINYNDQRAFLKTC